MHICTDIAKIHQDPSPGLPGHHLSAAGAYVPCNRAIKAGCFAFHEASVRVSVQGTAETGFSGEYVSILFNNFPDPYSGVPEIPGRWTPDRNGMETAFLIVI